MRADPMPDFPPPAWQPIQDVDSVDVAAKRKDGGVDLFIVVNLPAILRDNHLEIGPGEGITRNQFKEALNNKLPT